MKEFLETYIFYFLNQPFILSIMTLLLGGYLFSKISDRRAKKEKIREQAIKFVDEVANDINSSLSFIAKQIRIKNFKIDRELLIEHTLDPLFSKKFTVRIRSKVFLIDDEFSKKYDDLTWEIDKLVNYIVDLPPDFWKDLEKKVQIKEKIIENMKELDRKWPFHEKPGGKYGLDSPLHELMEWLGMIWRRANGLFVENLSKVIK